MNIRNVAVAAMAASAFALLSAVPAHADTVLFDGSGFLQGRQSFSQSFDLTTPGLLTVTLTNIAWPEKLTSLSFLATNSKGIVHPQMTEGSESFEVDSGRLVAQWFGDAEGPFKLGVYGLKIEFQPYTPTVPLPTSVVLLMSGLGLLLWQRRQREVTPVHEYC